MEKMKRALRWIRRSILSSRFGGGIVVGDFVEEAGATDKFAGVGCTLDEDAVLVEMRGPDACIGTDGQAEHDASLVASEEIACGAVLENNLFMCLDGFGLGEFVEAFARLEDQPVTLREG